MAKAEQPKKSSRAGRKPPTTPEARENQMISLAVDLAEKQLLEGTASSQLITHYLKLGTTREQLEQTKLENENKLLIAKAESLESQKQAEEKYDKALRAMRSYTGLDDVDD